MEACSNLHDGYAISQQESIAIREMLDGMEFEDQTFSDWEPEVHDLHSLDLELQKLADDDIDPFPTTTSCDTDTWGNSTKGQSAFLDVENTVMVDPSSVVPVSPVQVPHLSPKQELPEIITPGYISKKGNVSQGTQTVTLFATSKTLTSFRVSTSGTRPILTLHATASLHGSGSLNSTKVALPHKPVLSSLHACKREHIESDDFKVEVQNKREYLKDKHVLCVCDGCEGGTEGTRASNYRAIAPGNCTKSFQGSTVTCGSQQKVRRTVLHRPQPTVVNQSGKVYMKPPYSYSCLIAMALKNSKTGSLPVSSIYSFMSREFPYFLTAPNGWKNSVRHNLSLNKCFEKVTKSDCLSSFQRKGCLWTLNPAKKTKMDEELLKWSEKDPEGIRLSMANPQNLERLEKGELKLDYEPEGDAASLSASSDLDSEGEDTEVLSSQSSSQSSVESEPEEFCSSPVTGCSSFDLQDNHGAYHLEISEHGGTKPSRQGTSVAVMKIQGTDVKGQSASQGCSERILPGGTKYERSPALGPCIT